MTNGIVKIGVEEMMALHQKELHGDLLDKVDGENERGKNMMLGAKNLEG